MEKSIVRSPLRLLLLVLLLAGGVTNTRAQDAESEWPREIETSKGKIVVYQPQPELLEGNVLSGRTAVSVHIPDKPPVFGAVWFTSTLDIDRDERIARVIDVTIERVRFPDADPAAVQKLTDLIETVAPQWDISMSLDRLTTSLEAAERERGVDDDLNNDPPVIRFVTYPALLVTIDGEPELRKIGDTDLMRVVNTPFPIVFDPAGKSYYLYGTSVWFATADLVKGEWRPVDAPPAAVAALFSAEGAEPGAPEAPPAGEGVSPEKLRQAKIIVATTPTELIVAEGEPKWTPIAGNELLYMSNTGSDVFMDIATQKYYVLLSGRWFQSASMDGPWSYVPPPDVLAAFAAIPPESAKGSVLAQVPGTEEAKDAVMDAMIPQTSAVVRDEATIEVEYDGKPKFEPIPGTSIDYAVNTASQVLKVKDKYYACEQGVWYVATSPTGPWAVSDERPEEVDDIPAQSPVHNVKYVYVYDSTPSVVYVGYTPGYLGCYPYYGTVVYGTGWYYPPYVSPVYYYPRPCTWGFSVHYSPWGGWSYGMSWSAGWVTFSYGWGGGWGSWHHGYHRGYHHGYAAGWRAGYWSGVHAGGWFGPGGYRPRPEPYHGRPGGSRPGTRPGTLPADRPSTLPAKRPGNIYNRPENPNSPAIKPAIAERPAGGARPETRPSGGKNNVYVDRDGTVFRDQGKGWEKRDRDSWKPVSKPDQGAPSSPKPTPRPADRPAQKPSPRDISPRPTPQPAPPGPSTRPSQQPGRQKPSPQPAPSINRGSARDGGSIDSARNARARGNARAGSSHSQAPRPAPRGGRGGKR